MEVLAQGWEDGGASAVGIMSWDWESPCASLPSTLLHSPCTPVCSVAFWKLQRCPLMGRAAKIREKSKTQECKISHFMVRQRGQSDTGKVKTGQQSMKFGSFSDETATSETCCCSCRRAWAPDLMELDLKGLWFDTGTQSCICSIPRVGSCPKHHPCSCCHPSYAQGLEEQGELTLCQQGERLWGPLAPLPASRTHQARAGMVRVLLAAPGRMLGMRGGGGKCHMAWWFISVRNDHHPVIYTQV